MIAPSAAEVREARIAACLTQEEAAALVHFGRGLRWSEVERGVAPLDAARWELFRIKTGTHPGFVAVEAQEDA